MREGITLACPECKRRNYRTNKNKKNNAERIERNRLQRIRFFFTSVL